MSKPVYIVSGWMRSGTTMMMQALEAGGLEACYTPASAEYEFTQSEYPLGRDPEPYAGKVVKSLRVGPERMYPRKDGYRVIFMEREHAEQQRSWFEKANALAALETIEFQTRLSLALARNRKDTRVMTVSYGEVVANPKRELRRIARFLGERLDIDAAAAVIDPTMRHWRIEDMTGVTPLEAAHG